MKRKWLCILCVVLLFSAGLVFAAGKKEAKKEVVEVPVLRVRSAEGTDIVGADPGLASGENVSISLNIYSGLMRYKPGTYDLVLDAAKSVKVSEDGLEVYFELKEGIQFHEGYGEMTAEDVKFSFERIIDPELALPAAADWEGLDYVEVTGKYTGIIHMKKPSAQLFTLSIPFAAGSIISKAAYEERGRDKFNSAPIGSGPYYFKEWLPGEKVVLERFDDYYGEKPYFERVEIQVIEDIGAAELALERGDLHATSIYRDSVKRYEANPNIEVIVKPALAWDWVGFNCSLPPFDNVKVREAVRYALDIDKIIEGAYGGVAKRAYAMLPEGVVGHWKDAPRYERDVERAKKLLAEAGYPNGFDTQIILRTSEYMAAGEIVQAQLKDVGINATIMVAPDRYQTLGPENHPGMQVAGFSGHFEPNWFSTWFTSEQIGNWNFWKWSNKEYDRLNELALKTLNVDERAKIYIRMQQIIDEDVATIYITHRAITIAHSPKIRPYYLPGTHYAQYYAWEKIQ